MMENEGKYHLLHCQLGIADHNVKRVGRESTRDCIEWRLL